MSGNSPDSTNEDLPEPLEPNTARKCADSNCRSSRSRSIVRPQNSRDSCSVNGRSPGYGDGGSSRGAALMRTLLPPRPC